jgi:tetratricopeptide (TPR) repeat protein
MSNSLAVISCLACALLLSACAIDGDSVRADKFQASTLERALAESDVAVAAGQNDKAQQILRGAATTFPADKTPWLHIAQLKFDRGNYGEAIMNALEALQRDPNDKLGNSIVAVSGLRLSTRALSDLSLQNNLSGSLRSEAQDLAKLLRTSLGEEVLVPPTGASRKPVAARRPAATPAASVPASGKTGTGQASNSDPFGGLK